MEESKAMERPEWALGGGQINEVRFCEDYTRENTLLSRDGVFYTTEGRMFDERPLREDIFNAIAPYVHSGLHKKVNSIVEVMRLKAISRREQDLCTCLHTLHVANGTYFIDSGYFMPDKFCCRHRLPVDYNPKAAKPERWLQFLSELLHEEDIPTLQEFMGYCMIPTNMGQKMLILTGRGGEGKSRIGIVLKELLGKNMNAGSLNKIETNRFARADLEHLLVHLDDDLKMEALSQTNHIKSIITAELPMDLEKKGIQSYQGMLTVRFIAFGNDTLQALHDRSYGFFRRQIILTTKDRPADRVDDPYLSIRLKAEKEGIFLWCLEGLERLMCNDFRFTISPRAEGNLRRAMAEGNNLEEFMRSEGYFRFDPEGKITSRSFYAVYSDWCEDNLLRPLSQRTFWGFLNQNAARYGLRQSTHIPAGSGKFVRGFQGARKVSRL